MTNQEFWQALIDYYGAKFPYEQEPGQLWKDTINMLNPTQKRRFLGDLRNRVTGYTKRCPTPGELLGFFNLKVNANKSSPAREIEFKQVQETLMNRYAEELTQLARGYGSFAMLRKLSTLLANNEVRRFKPDAKFLYLT